MGMFGTIQRRVMLYFITLTLASVAVLCMLLAGIGVFSSANKEVAKGLDIQLRNSITSIEQRYEALTAQGLTFSRQLGRILDTYFQSTGAAIDTLDNNEAALLEIQGLVYEPLYTILQMADCNGVYFILDATVNTSVENVPKTRSGLYLRFASVKVNSAENMNVTMYRGNPGIARRNGIELHNGWKLELYMEGIPYYDEILEVQPEYLFGSYYWTEKVDLPGSWESAVMLGVPVLGQDGTFYGVCGFEISELLFRFSYPVVDTEFGPMITVLAPKAGGELLLSHGLTGGVGNYFSGTESLAVSEDKRLLVYTSDGAEFVGKESIVKLSSQTFQTNSEWMVATLLPKENYRAYDKRTQIFFIISLIALLIALLIVSRVLSKRYARPIISAIETIQSEYPENAAATNIMELDMLIERIKQLRKPGNPMPEDFFLDFFDRVKTLTKAEKEVVKLIISGRKNKEIQALMCITVNTLKSHSRHIYKKLGISSKDELMLYIELINKSGKEKIFIDFLQKSPLG